MTTSQIIRESINTTVFGMGLVLVTLYILSLILDLMRIIFNPRSKVKKNEDEIEEDSIDQTLEKSETNSEEDSQLIAVISAALAAHLQTPLSTIKIGKIRKIHEKTPIWGIESRIYNINNKLYK